jgi:hypothetical protein
MARYILGVLGVEQLHQSIPILVIKTLLRQWYCRFYCTIRGDIPVYTNLYIKWNGWHMYIGDIIIIKNYVFWDYFGMYGITVCSITSECNRSADTSSSARLQISEVRCTQVQKKFIRYSDFRVEHHLGHVKAEKNAGVLVWILNCCQHFYIVLSSVWIRDANLLRISSYANTMASVWCRREFQYRVTDDNQKIRVTINQSANQVNLQVLSEWDYQSTKTHEE